MSEAAPPARPPEAGTSLNTDHGRIAELKVSGYLMTLDAGLFCVSQAPGSPSADDLSGLPGVRISLPPGSAGGPEAVSISTFHEHGWLNCNNTAALIRVANGPAQVLVTVYQSLQAPPDMAPRLQVMRLGTELNSEAQATAPDTAVMVPAAVSPDKVEILVHVQRAGDMPARIGEWAGTRGSGQWIEGFSLTPGHDIIPSDIEYQAVLGRGWLSPWIEGGKFCGSRGMALPLLGFKLRLKGRVAKTHECSYSATFVDGTSVDLVPGGESCEAESFAPLEAFRVAIGRRGAGFGTGGSASRASRSRGRQPTTETASPEPTPPTATTQEAKPSIPRIKRSRRVLPRTTASL